MPACRTSRACCTAPIARWASSGAGATGPIGVPAAQAQPIELPYLLALPHEFGPDTPLVLVVDGHARRRGADPRQACRRAHRARPRGAGGRAAVARRAQRPRDGHRRCARPARLRPQHASSSVDVLGAVQAATRCGLALPDGVQPARPGGAAPRLLARCHGRQHRALGRAADRHDGAGRPGRRYPRLAAAAGRADPRRARTSPAWAAPRRARAASAPESARRPEPAWSIRSSTAALARRAAVRARGRHGRSAELRRAPHRAQQQRPPAGHHRRRGRGAAPAARHPARRRLRHASGRAAPAPRAALADGAVARARARAGRPAGRARADHRVPRQQRPALPARAAGGPGRRGRAPWRRHAALPATGRGAAGRRSAASQGRFHRRRARGSVARGGRRCRSRSTTTVRRWRGPGRRSSSTAARARDRGARHASCSR